ncbi:hypothetical protein Q5O14_14065 [Eubacteriaceae bacterium ES2]|nr:hypothetical protein Q5O14_14065 [Eubacteriaceae bacterium ES2]
MEQKEYITDDQVVKRANAAVRLELEKKRAMDMPVTAYDRKTGTIYQVNSDGSKTELGKRLKKGRYSERVTKKA